MKFGIAVTTSVTPAVTESSQRDYVEKVSVAAESTGYDSVWVSDRTVFPSDLVAKYPDRFGEGKGDPRAQNVLEALTTLSYVAGLTKKVDEQYLLDIEREVFVSLAGESLTQDRIRHMLKKGKPLRN